VAISLEQVLRYNADQHNYSHTVFALLLTFHIKRVVDAIQRAVVAPQVEISKSVLRGGRSFGIARHWHPGLKKYMIPPAGPR
jgi:hypothetical protein